MLCINNINTDAYFNIATEEYLLKNLQENIFMLYRNEPSVIIGRHQNVWTEVNTEFAKENHLKIVRRYSGGGAVFHDLGNFNLTFIENGSNLNFDRFTNTMIDMLSSIGISSQSDDRRALTIDGYKISGSAQGIYKNRVMYHATLLFSSNLVDLTTSLEGNNDVTVSDKPERLYVRSVKSPVTNILEHSESGIEISDFTEFVMNYFLKKSIDNIVYQFSEKDITGIELLRNNKYSTQEWNYDGTVPSNKNKTKANLLPVRL